MASKEQVNYFISQVAPPIVAECNKRGYRYPSAIIAQACVESSYGSSQLSAKYNNFFGLKAGSSWKGRAVNLATKEEYTPGVITNINSMFRIYDSIEDGIAGYFDFISTPRYSNLKDAISSRNYLERIKEDGYATSSKYVSLVYSVVKSNKLTEYDNGKQERTKYYRKYTGYSYHIDDVFEAIGVQEKYIGNWRRRRPIAAANGIKKYTGSSNQNVLLLDLAKSGRLKKV